MSNVLIDRILELLHNENGIPRVRQMTVEEYDRLEPVIIDAIWSSKSIDEIRGCVEYNHSENYILPYNVCVAICYRQVELDYKNPEAYQEYAFYLSAFGDPTYDNLNKIEYLNRMEDLLISLK